MVRLSHYRHLDFQENRAAFNDRIENRLAANWPSAPQSSSIEDITDQYIFHDEEGANVVAYLSPGLVARLEVVKIYRDREVIVGRQHTCDLQIRHPLCSHKHFRIYSVVFDAQLQPLIYCEDLSLNGTFFNGRLIGRNRSALLTTGDRIDIVGVACFYFRQRHDISPAISEDDTAFQREKENLTSDYIISNRILGMGAYGRVYMAWDTRESKQVACKVVRLGGCTTGSRPKSRGAHLQEVEILASMNHPNILGIRKVISTDDNIYIFEDLITGGDLFSRLGEKDAFSEVEAMPIVWQLLKALDYMHQHGVVHRDLKPDNILCTRHVNGARIVLADFGSARFFTPETRMTSAVGTLEYLAPEILMPELAQPFGGYTQAVDYWSLGIVIYVLLSGTSPFARLPASLSDYELSRLDYGKEWVGKSHEAKDFIRRLLTVEPQNRMDVHEARCHTWLARHAEELERLYERAIEGCEERDEDRFSIERQDKRKGSPGNVPHAGSVMSDVPDLLFDGSVSSQSPAVAGSIVEDESEQEGEHESWDTGVLYTAEENLLHEEAASDGQLRSAGELSRQVEILRGRGLQQHEAEERSNSYSRLF